MVRPACEMRMKKQLYTFDFWHAASLEELPDADRQLVEQARKACASAYAPYSGFRVGAAVRLSDGRVRTASNQESEVFPSGMCAERSLLYAVQGELPAVSVEAMALASEPAGEECYPCGACRQVLFDTERRQNRPIRVIMSGADSATVVERAQDLLPFTFRLEK